MLFPAEERTDVRRAGPSSVPRLGDGENERSIHAHALPGELAHRFEARFAGTDLDHEVWRPLAQGKPLSENLLPIRQVRIDFDAHGLISAADELRDFVGDDTK